MSSDFLKSILMVLCLFANPIFANVLNDEASALLLNRSRQMSSFMNEEIDPCENFYEFTCGKWPTIYPAQADRSLQTNYLKLINEAYERKVIEMLQSKQDPNDLVHEKKVKNVYQSCLKLKDGVNPEDMLKVIADFDKLPALETNDDKWDEDSFDWLDTLARIKKKYGFQILIRLDVGPDLKDNSSNRIYIGEAEFTFKSKSIYLEPMGAQYLRKYSFDIAITLSNQLSINMFEAFMMARQIISFEIKLAKGMVDNKSDISLEKLLINTTADELQQKYAPAIDVKRFLNIIFGEVPEGMMYEYVPGYLQNVKEVIETAKKRDVANYIYYQLIRNFKVKESRTTEELETNCLTKMQKHLNSAIENMFYRRFLDKQIEEGIKNLWDEIKNTFKAKLQNSDTINWMTSETRKKALEKLEVLKLHISSFEDYDFSKDFDNLTTYEDDFVGNLQRIIQLDTERTLKLLHEPVSKIEPTNRASLSAYLSQAENIIYVPVSVLQPYYLWAPNYPDALKFSLTGFLLAHELIHAFDDTGRHFGESGNLEDWWDSESTNKFLERRSCFIDQYHSYFYGKIQLPKTEMQSENIADNGGLKLAYDAFTTHLSNSVSDDDSQKLPNFKYSEKQLFFIGYGQFWCSDIHNFVVNLQAATDDHTLGMFRTIGTVSNSADFAEAFNCAVGSKMNPEKKCKIY